MVNYGALNRIKLPKEDAIEEDKELDPLEFFQERIANFDSERKIFADYFNLIQPNKGEIHILDWDSRQQEDINIKSINEHSTLDAEIEKLKDDFIIADEEFKEANHSQMARKEQIRRLLDLAQPVERDTTYLYLDKHVKLQSKVVPNNGIKNPTNNASQHYGEEPSSVVYAKQFRNSDIERLEHRVEEETRKVQQYYNTLSLSLRDAKDVIVKQKNNSDNKPKLLIENTELLINEADKYDQQAFLATSELLKLRLKIMVAQREEVDELERLSRGKKFFEEKTENARVQLMNDIKKMKNLLKLELAQASKDFNKQTQSLQKKCELMAIKEEKIQAAYNKTLGAGMKLREENELAIARYEKLRRRNALEMEGYHNEATKLRARLTNAQKLYALKKNLPMNDIDIDLNF